MVECTALEMRRTREGTVGSNPTLSANYLLTSLDKSPPGAPRSTVDRAWPAYEQVAGKPSLLWMMRTRSNDHARRFGESQARK